MSACPNCAAEVTGAYCPACGERRIHDEDLSIRRLSRHLIGDVAAFKQLKAIRSLRALLVPGKLTAEFLAGRRQRWLSPLKLYFVCAAIFFLASPWVGFSLTALIERDHTGELGRLVAARVAERGLDLAAFTRRFDSRVQTVYTLGTTLCVLFSAALLQLLSRRTGRPFGMHLIFALHYLSVLFLVAVLSGVAIRQLHVPFAVAVSVTYVLLGVYLYVALRRVYGDAVGWALLKTGALLALTFEVFDLVGAGAIWLTLRLA
jgi:hypothetical protein